MSPVYTTRELRKRLHELRADGERLYRLNYFDRLWLARYASNADVIADCLEELLDQGAITSVDSFVSSFARRKHASS